MGRKDPTPRNHKPRLEGDKNPHGVQRGQGPPSQPLPSPGNLHDRPRGRAVPPKPRPYQKTGAAVKTLRKGAHWQTHTTRLEEQAQMPPSLPRKGNSPRLPESQHHQKPRPEPTDGKEPDAGRKGDPGERQGGVDGTEATNTPKSQNELQRGSPGAPGEETTRTLPPPRLKCNAPAARTRFVSTTG